MREYSIKGFKRDPRYFDNIIVPDENDEGEIVTKNIELLFPTRFVDIGVGAIGRAVSIPSIYMVVSDAKYAISTVPVKLDFLPSKIETVSVDEVTYYLLTFSKGQQFTVNNTTVKADIMLFDLYTEFITNGRIPFFFEYDDISKVFTESRKYNDSNMGDDSITIDLLTSIICRDANDLNKYYRETDMKGRMKTIALSNVTHGYHNSLSKISGNYLNLGIDSVMASEPEDPIGIEKLLRL